MQAEALGKLDLVRILDPAIEPSRFSMRPNGRCTIAWSDYGPASGKPVLIVHSNWCCRFVPRVLAQELQRRGWRPIAIDRPGFGGTSLGSSSKDDPFGQAIEDVLQVLDAAKIEQIPIIARCGAQFTLACKAAAPERVAARRDRRGRPGRADRVPRDLRAIPGGPARAARRRRHRPRARSGSSPSSSGRCRPASRGSRSPRRPRRRGSRAR